MADRPDARDLLDIARRTFVDSLLPALPPDRRYEGLMLANALAIALRELEAPPQADAEQDRRLAAEIRAGRYDAAGPEREAVARQLRQRATARVAASNPKALA
jgi:hypothetical protein